MIHVQSFVAEFWLAGCRDMVRNTLALLREANEPLDRGNVLAVLRSLPSSKDVQTYRVTESFFGKCLVKLNADNPEHERIGDYFLVEVPPLSAPARQMLLKSIMGVLVGIGWPGENVADIPTIVAN